MGETVGTEQILLVGRAFCRAGELPGLQFVRVQRPPLTKVGQAFPTR